MCGITGVFDLKNQPDRKLLNLLLNPIHHRGPDATGYFLAENIAMGMKRLSIIDLKSGNQPIYNEDKSLAIVFNGEIYNYLELRSELLKKGHKFKTTSDTEVLVHLYEEYKHDSPKHLNGMFAYSIYDKKKRELFIARDHAGIKPLYYFYDKRKFVYGSELKSILSFPNFNKEINPEALKYYSTLGYIPSNISIFKHIYKLKPGHSLTISKKGIKEHKYFDLKNIKIDKSLDELILESVSRQSIADVPVGVFLSGGLDSSLITHYLRKVKKDKLYTFSISFSEKSFNESDYAHKVAKIYKTTHIEESFSFKDVLSLFPILSSQLDEPLADPSLFPTYKVSKLARTKVKVVLSGDGGDELFGGYPTYQGFMMSTFFKNLSTSSLKAMIKILDYIPANFENYPKTEILKTFILGLDKNKHIQHQKWMGIDHYKNFDNKFLTKKDLEKIDDQIFNYDSIRSIQYLDYLTYLRDDLLVKVDRASMFNSLEVRVPFLDPRIIQYAFSYPQNHLSFNETKILLRKLAKENFPEEIYKRKKKGFGIPIAKWLNGELKDLGFDSLSNNKLDIFFERKKINNLWTEHQKLKRNNGKLLWVLIIFSQWLEKWN